MITKADSRAYEGIAYPRMRPKLSVLERGMLKWAVIDRDDRVLDVGLGSGLLADHLRRNMECEVCGVADSMELVRRTRSLVCSADLVYAGVGDIPWKNEAFHTVLARAINMNRSDFAAQMREIHRVMKDGGQLVVGMNCLPRVVNAVKKLMGEPFLPEQEQIPRKEAEKQLSKIGFTNFCWERTGLSSGVLICWKKTGEDTKAE